MTYSEKELQQIEKFASIYLKISDIVCKPKGRFFRSTNQKNRPFGLWFVILHNFYIGVFSWFLIA